MDNMLSYEPEDHTNSNIYYSNHKKHSTDNTMLNYLYIAFRTSVCIFNINSCSQVYV